MTKEGQKFRIVIWKHDLTEEKCRFDLNAPWIRRRKKKRNPSELIQIYIHLLVAGKINEKRRTTTVYLQIIIPSIGISSSLAVPVSGSCPAARGGEIYS